MSDKTDIKSMTLPELEVFTTEVLGEKKFRAKQIYEWMHVRLADSFDEMTNLSKNLRQKLSEQCVLTHLEMVEKYVSAIDGTAKYLFKLSDDRIIESVLMHFEGTFKIQIMNTGKIVCNPAEYVDGLLEAEEMEDERKLLVQS